jgi:hypothetical protein
VTETVEPGAPAPKASVAGAATDITALTVAVVVPPSVAAKAGAAIVADEQSARSGGESDAPECGYFFHADLLEG